MSDDDKELAQDLLLRGMPAEMLKQVDAFAAKQSQKFAKPSRNAALLLLIERGLSDVRRAR